MSIIKSVSPIMAMFASGPALISQEQAAYFDSCIRGASSDPDFPKLAAEASSQDEGFWFAADDWRAKYRPYVVQNGILHVPVKGVLLHDFPWQLGSWATGYDYILRCVERGMQDPNVKGIALVCHTPGGMVAGCFEMADKLFAMRGQKPIRGFAHEMAYSAGYMTISCADSVVVSRTGGVGSIGVITTHLDWSGYNEKAGLKYTFIFEGEGKSDGNPEEPLSDDAKKRIQARIADLYQIFVSSVARNRGIEESVIRNGLKAHTYGAAEALSNGLADKIGPLDDALAAFAADLSSTSGDETMSTQDTSAADQAALDAARSEGRAEAETATADAVANAKKAERERVAAITGCEEAKGRGDLANHIAMNTEMSVDDAKAMLAAAPKQASTESAGTPFDAAAGAGNPELGASADGNEQDANPAAETLAIAHQIGLSGLRSTQK